MDNRILVFTQVIPLYFSILQSIKSSMSFSFSGKFLMRSGMLALVCMLLSYAVMGQKLQLNLGNPEIGLNEYYTITLSIQDGRLDDFGNFPNIPGMSKAGTSSSSSMSSINGRVTQEYSIIQNYRPEKQGTFVLAPFLMKVNGQTVKSPGAKIMVGPAVDRRSSDPFGSNPFAYDPFEDFFGRGRDRDMRDAKADAFFSIQTDKKEIWAGEGFTLTISFLVSDENQAELSFYDIGNQLTAMVKKIKPGNCWEENFGIEEIEQRKVKIGNKNYTEYRIYQAGLFPQTAGKIDIPSLKLDMLSQSGGFFGRSKEEIKSFSSRPFSILVKELPEHPMKGKAAVGSFQLEEKQNRKSVTVGQGLSYDFTVRGEGNISYIQEPSDLKSGLADVYPPNSSQTIQRSGGRVTGSKTFSYLLVPREQGAIQASRILEWIFFNVKTGRYDTLRPRLVFQVVRGKKTASGKQEESEDSFYSLLKRTNTSIVDLSDRRSGNLLWYNLAIAAMALVTVVLMVRKNR
jgi:hypothetical protein